MRSVSEMSENESSKNMDRRVSTDYDASMSSVSDMSEIEASKSKNHGDEGLTDGEGDSSLMSSEIEVGGVNG
jgi:hypothetical protein